MANKRLPNEKFTGGEGVWTSGLQVETLMLTTVQIKVKTKFKICHYQFPITSDRDWIMTKSDGLWSFEDGLLDSTSTNEEYLQRSDRSNDMIQVG